MELPEKGADSIFKICEFLILLFDELLLLLICLVLNFVVIRIVKFKANMYERISVLIDS